MGKVNLLFIDYCIVGVGVLIIDLCSFGFGCLDFLFLFCLFVVLVFVVG